MRSGLTRESQAVFFGASRPAGRVGRVRGDAGGNVATHDDLNSQEYAFCSDAFLPGTASGRRTDAGFTGMDKLLRPGRSRCAHTQAFLAKWGCSSYRGEGVSHVRSIVFTNNERPVARGCPPSIGGAPWPGSHSIPDLGTDGWPWMPGLVAGLSVERDHSSGAQDGPYAPRKAC